MSKIKLFLLMLVFSLVAFAGFSQEATWLEMEKFHSVMSVSFHPAEDNNLKPVREKASDLLTKAKEWQSSAAPKGFNGTVTTPILKRLVKQCRLIDVAVKKNKSDAELKKMITKAHDIFHEIKEKCRE